MSHQKEKEKKVCPGYGPYDRRCGNVANLEKGDYWCDRCKAFRDAQRKSVHNIIQRQLKGTSDE